MRIFIKKKQCRLKGHPCGQGSYSPMWWDAVSSIFPAHTRSVGISRQRRPGEYSPGATPVSLVYQTPNKIRYQEGTRTFVSDGTQTKGSQGLSTGDQDLLESLLDDS